MSRRRRRSPSTPQSVDYMQNEYHFTASAGFDYNYDPLKSSEDYYSFDPYADYTTPVSSQTHASPHTRSQSYDRAYEEPSYLSYVDHEQPGPSRQYYNSRSVTPPPPLPTPPIVPTITVTSPTPEYIRASETPSNPLQNPSECRKLLVLDLNGTLLFRSPLPPRNLTNRYPSRRHHPNQNDKHSSNIAETSTELRPLRPVHPRPYLTCFTRYLFHPNTRLWLDTMVWSSAQPHSVNDMVDKCFGKHRDDLVAVWARDTLGLDEREYHRKTQTTKDLAKPWSLLPLASTPSPLRDALPPELLSTSPQSHSAQTTLLLDDSPLKAHLQPWNHLCIREYVAEMRKSDLEIAEGELRKAIKRPGVVSNEESSTNELEEDRAQGDEGDNTQNADSTDGDQESAEQKVSDTLEARQNTTTSTKKKRKRPKDKKAKRATATAAVPVLEVKQYDQTLLAVIGILNAVKRETNVAGWMRKGGLLNSNEIGSVVDSTEVSIERPASQLQAHETSQKNKRRRLDDGGKEEAATVVPDYEYIPALERKTPTVTLGSTLKGSTTPPVMWYEDKTTMQSWVERGIRALEELGIEAISGVS